MPMQVWDVMIGPSEGNASITGGSSEFIGDYAGSSVTAGGADVFVGSYAGKSNTTGNGDVYVGFHAGTVATTAAYGTFVGAQAGISNTTGSFNTFLGISAGDANTTGANNTFLGAESGGAITSGSSDIYINNFGANNESNAIRIGDPANQNAAYIAGIYGASVAGGQPVVIDSTGHLGSSPAVSVTGTVAGNSVNSTTGYQIGGVTELNVDPHLDVMIGPSAGNGSMTGGNSEFIGDFAGSSLSSGNADAFLGSYAGKSTTTGNGDVYVGFHAGAAGTTAPSWEQKRDSMSQPAQATPFLGFLAGNNVIAGSSNIDIAVANRVAAGSEIAHQSETSNTSARISAHVNDEPICVLESAGKD
jgi:hypothetical protein